jgi:hypothetical protein
MKNLASAARGIAVALVALTSACSHGSSATSALPGAGSATSQPAATATIRLTMTIPARGVATTTIVSGKRTVQYVSPSTLSGVVTVNGGAAQIFDLSVASPMCVSVSGGRACSLPVKSPVGSDTFAITLYDSAYTGSLPTGNPLSAASNFMATIAEGQSNVTLPLVLGGVPATSTLTVFGDPGTSTVPAHNVPIIVTAKDAQANTIIGAAPYVNASGAAVPIVVSEQLMPLVNSNDPPLVLNGTSLGTATSATIASPTDALAFTADAAGQALLGVPLRVTSGIPAAVTPAYYHAPGPTSGTIPATTNLGLFLGNSLNTVFAGPTVGYTGADSLYAGSSAGWVADFTSSGGSNWGTLAANTYCYPTPAASVVGLAVATDGSFYATTQVGGLFPVFGHYALGAANTPCSPVAGQTPIAFSLAFEGGAIVIGNNVVYAISHSILTIGIAEQIMVALPDLSQSSIILDNGTGGFLDNPAGAVLDPTDNSLWAVAHTNSRLIHISGTTGTPSSYSASYTGLDPSCLPDGIVTDGRLLYISCSAASEILVVNPATPGAYGTLSGTGRGSGGVVDWQDITFGPDGFLWLLDGGSAQIQKYSTTSGTSIATFTSGSDFSNLVTGGDGDLWLGSAAANNFVARFAQGVGP